MRLSEIIYGRVKVEKESTSKEVLKRVQSIMLEILLEVHRICEKENLKYWLDSGTLLGAVRHKGFIPWDDDLDICMPIEDYFRFLEIAPKELPDDMILQTRKTDRGFIRDFAKIRSDKGRILERFEAVKEKQGRKIKYHTGIYIDIFPCITIERSKLRLHKVLLKLTKRLFKTANIGVVMESWCKVVDKFMHSGWEEKDLLVVRSARYPEEDFYVPLDTLYPLRLYDFEGYKFWGPFDHEPYLRVLYGNYMELPPPEERSTHAYRLEVFD
jgi:lipopolysaccharide cholinephosphotransferase